MDKETLSAAWMRRAKSNLAQARVGKGDADIALEDLCFNAQQAAEKAFKALCVLRGISFSHTHSISHLLSLIESDGCPAPKELDEADTLTEYAVNTRYPGDWEPIDESEYKEALSLAEKAVAWVQAFVKT